jgi:hypothetical protein
MRIFLPLLIVFCFGPTIILAQSDSNSGIGTDTPGSKLEIKAENCDSTKSALHVKNNCDSSLLFVRNDTRIGIGTRYPQARLHVYGRTGVGTNRIFQVGSLTLANLFSIREDGTMGMGIGAGRISSLPNEAVLIGDGTGSSNLKLMAGAGEWARVYWFYDGAYSAEIVAGNEAGSLLINPLTRLKFLIGSSEIARLTSSGLGIGTSSPSALLHAHGSTGTGTNKVFQAGSSTISDAFYVQEDGTVNTKSGYWIDGNRIIYTPAGSGSNLNFFVGKNVGNTTLTGYSNYFFAQGAGGGITSGISNIGIGDAALASVTSGSSNAAIGAGALYRLATGNDNCFIGQNAAAYLLISA